MYVGGEGKLLPVAAETALACDARCPHAVLLFYFLLFSSFFSAFLNVKHAVHMVGKGVDRAESLNWQPSRLAIHVQAVQ